MEIFQTEQHKLSMTSQNVQKKRFIDRRQMYVFVRKLKMDAMVTAQTDIVFLCSHGGVIFYI